MFSRSMLFAALVCSAPLAAVAQDTLPAGQPAAEQAPQMSPEEFNRMVSYALGRSIAEDCKMGGVTLDVRAMQTGISEVQQDRPPQWSEREMNQAMQLFAMKIQQTVAANNKKAGQEFLAKNAQQPGVKVTPSGLQYKVVKQGNGASPTDDSAVVCHYRGTFVNGQVFDSTQGGQPAQFPVKGVIAGWTEALKMMKVGDKWQLFVPSNLAYGEGGQGPIGPNETLIFEIELLQVGPARPAPRQ
ncbi:FKBP-type peptidyl-prolyl cis-trans isomerase [Aeoliella sp.]|uniref:FKBP-type peptidyl-prolyl cis-trans isomerase n=1 Tax=Aeoliella sp. TaxID=2795800 RepID=UPI003CCC117C